MEHTWYAVLYDEFSQIMQGNITVALYKLNNLSFLYTFCQVMSGLVETVHCFMKD